MNVFPAPAKINLHLKVIRTLENGYHELDTSFAYVDIADQLTITPMDQLHVTCSKPHLSGESNLVYKVLDALRKQHGLSGGLSVHIQKQLPDQAGLGGGSSDAATALMVANSYWKLGLSTEELMTFSTHFGADIPCFLFGQASLASGIGDKLAVYPENLPDGYILLAHPGVGLSTPSVFNCYDQQLNSASALTHHNRADTIRARSETAIGSNDLEACACSLSSEVGCLLKEMRTASKMAWMSGSGSTCIALFANRQEAENTANLLQERKLSSWTHVGKLLKKHPLQSIEIGA
ncbi:MAG: 4-(cytidine 5'-diphospho)-2-C-methyl-D-erythritol kinase [Mariprofundaceae bacterium]